MRQRRVKPLDEAVQHATSATDKTDVLESKLINPYKGRSGVTFLVVKPSSSSKKHQFCIVVVLPAYLH